MVFWLIFNDFMLFFPNNLYTILRDWRIYLKYQLSKMVIEYYFVEASENNFRMFLAKIIVVWFLLIVLVFIYELIIAVHFIDPLKECILSYNLVMSIVNPSLLGFHHKTNERKSFYWEKRLKLFILVQGCFIELNIGWF